MIISKNLRNHVTIHRLYKYPNKLSFLLIHAALQYYIRFESLISTSKNYHEGSIHNLINQDNRHSVARTALQQHFNTLFLFFLFCSSFFIFMHDLLRLLVLSSRLCLLPRSNASIAQLSVFFSPRLWLPSSVVPQQTLVLSGFLPPFQLSPSHLPNNYLCKMSPAFQLFI